MLTIPEWDWRLIWIRWGSFNLLKDRSIEFTIRNQRCKGQ